MLDPNEKITYPERGVYGQTLYMGRRTAAHLDWTKAELAKVNPAARLVVIQGAYNVGVAASAGTHDKDACLDVQIVGMAWLDAQRFLREHGWAAWYRYPPTFSEHIHMVSLGCTGPVGIYVPGQIADYYAHRSGLAGHVLDGTWHPTNIDSTIFDYPGWVAAQEDNMGYTDWAQADKDALVSDVVTGLLSTKLGNGDTVQNNLRRAGDVKAIAQEVAKVVNATARHAGAKKA